VLVGAVIAGEAVIAGATGTVPGLSGIVIGLCSEGEVTAGLERAIVLVGLAAGKLEGLEGSVGVEDVEMPHRPHVIYREHTILMLCICDCCYSDHDSNSGKCNEATVCNKRFMCKQGAKLGYLTVP